MAAGGRGAELADSLMRRLEALRDDAPPPALQSADELAARADALFYGNAGQAAESLGRNMADSLEQRLATLAGEVHPAKRAIADARASLRPGAADYEERLMLLQLAESMDASGDHAAALSALRAGDFAVPATDCRTVASSPANELSHSPARARGRVSSEAVERLAAEGAAAAARDLAALSHVRHPHPGLVADGAPRPAPSRAFPGSFRADRPTPLSGASPGSDSEGSSASSSSSSRSSSSGSSSGSSSSSSRDNSASRRRRSPASLAEEACAAASRLLREARHQL